MKQLFRLILMHNGVLMDSVRADNLLGAMGVLTEKIKKDTFWIKISACVKKKVQIGPYEYEKQNFPGGIIIASSTTGNGLYSLECSDIRPVISVLLATDIAEMQSRSVGSS